MQGSQDKSERAHTGPGRQHAFVYLSQQEEKCLAKPESLEHEEVINSRHRQHRHPLLLPQHAGRRTPQASEHPAPAPGCRAAPEGPVQIPAKSAVSHIAEKRQQEKQSGADVRPPHHTGHRFRVDWVRGEEEAGQKAPWPAAAQERTAEGGEEGGDQAVQRHVQQVVAPGPQGVQGVVEAEGEGAERAEGLVAAAVSEQGAPEVIVQDVGPRSLGEKVLVGLDGSAGGGEEKTTMTMRQM